MLNLSSLPVLSIGPTSPVFAGAVAAKKAQDLKNMESAKALISSLILAAENLFSRDTGGRGPPPVPMSSASMVNQLGNTTKVGATSITRATLIVTPPGAAKSIPFPVSSAQISFGVMSGSSGVPTASFSIPMGQVVSRGEPSQSLASIAAQATQVANNAATLLGGDLPTPGAPADQLTASELKQIVPGSRVDFYVVPSGDMWTSTPSQAWAPSTRNIAIYEGEAPYTAVLLFSGIVDGTPMDVSGQNKSLSITCVHWLAEFNRGSFMSNNLTPVDHSDVSNLLGPASDSIGGAVAVGLQGKIAEWVMPVPTPTVAYTQKQAALIDWGWSKLQAVGLSGAHAPTPFVVPTVLPPVDVFDTVVSEAMIALCTLIGSVVNDAAPSQSVSSLITAANRLILAYEGVGNSISVPTAAVRIRAILGDSEAAALWTDTYGNSWDYHVNDPDGVIVGNCVMAGTQSVELLGQIVRAVSVWLTQSMGSASPLDLMCTILDQLQLMIIPTTTSFTVVPRALVRPNNQTWRVIPSAGIIRCTGTDMAGYGIPGSLIYIGNSPLSGSVGGAKTQPTQAMGAWRIGEGPTSVRHVPLFLLQDAQVAGFFDVKTVTGYEALRKALNSATISAANYIATGMAQSDLYAERTARHTMSVQLPFRTDISPGSQIALDGLTGEATTNTAANEANRVYGFVSRVSFNIDANSATASTHLTLTNTRKGTDYPDLKEGNMLYPAAMNPTKYMQASPYGRLAPKLTPKIWCGSNLTDNKNFMGSVSVENAASKTKILSALNPLAGGVVRAAIGKLGLPGASSNPDSFLCPQG